MLKLQAPSLPSVTTVLLPHVNNRADAQTHHLNHIHKGKEKVSYACHSDTSTDEEGGRRCSQGSEKDGQKENEKLIHLQL